MREPSSGGTSPFSLADDLSVPGPHIPFLLWPPGEAGKPGHVSILVLAFVMVLSFIFQDLNFQ